MLLASCEATASINWASHDPRPADCDLARAPFGAIGPPPGRGRVAPLHTPPSHRLAWNEMLRASAA
eukprot:6995128-Heterocapsa_arctica.AAC.1